MTLFRPCIDLHQGKVKQIVGGSLNQSGAETNFISPHDAAYYAELYKQHNLSGGHVISLGPNNKQQALNALSLPTPINYSTAVALHPTMPMNLFRQVPHRLL